MLASAGLRTLNERCHGCHGNVLACQQIGRWSTHLLRWTVRFAGQIHHAGITFRNEVIAGQVRTRSAEAKTGNRYVDEFGVDLFERGVIET